LLKLERQMPSESNLHVYFTLLGVQFLFSGYHIVSQVALNSNAVSPYMLCFVRELIATPLLFIFAFLVVSTSNAKSNSSTSKLALVPELYDIPRFIGLGFTGIFGNQVFFLLGLQMTSPTNAAIMQPLIPVITTVIALLLRYEPPLDLKNSAYSRWKVLGILSAVGGAVVMMLGDTANATASANPNQNLFLGNLLLVANCFSFSCFVLLQKPILGKYAPPVITCWSYLFGAVFVGALAAPYWIQPESWTSLFNDDKVIGAIVYAAVCSSAIAFALITWANSRVQGVVTTLFQAAQPFSTSLLALIVFGTLVTLVQIFGAALIITGLVLVCLAKDREQKQLLQQDIDDLESEIEEQHAEADEEQIAGLKIKLITEESPLIGDDKRMTSITSPASIMESEQSSNAYDFTPKSL